MHIEIPTFEVHNKTINYHISRGLNQGSVEKCNILIVLEISMDNAKMLKVLQCHHCFANTN
jgi:hypothetical protein